MFPINRKTNQIVLNNLEIPILLDLIQFPCLMVDISSGIIISANDAFIDQTRLSIVDLVGAKIQSIFSKISFEKCNESEKYQTEFIFKGKKRESIEFSIKYLKSDQRIGLVLFEKNFLTKSDNKIIHQTLIDDMYELLDNITSVPMDTIYTRLVIAGKRAFGEYVYLYIPQAKNATLVKCDASEENFPNQLPYIELERINGIDYWTNGRRVLTEIHRIGRNNKFITIITFPIGTNQKSLLVLGFRSFHPYDSMANLVSMYQKWASINLDFVGKTKQNQDEMNGLKDQIQILSAIQKKSFEGIIITDENFSIEYSNESANKLLGYTSYELINQDLFKILQNKKLEKLFQRVGNQDNKEWVVKPVFIHDRNGQKIPALYHLIDFAEENIKQKLVIFKDESAQFEFQQKEEKLEEKASLGEVIADFAHEVRNPINNISTGLQLLQKKIEPSDSVQSILSRMHDDCIRMNDLMESILSFSRQDQKDFRKIEIVGLIERIVNQLREKSKKNNVEISFSKEFGEAIIFGNMRSLEQVILNLINNSLEAISENLGGSIFIKISQNPSDTNLMDIKISDTGYGIPEEIGKDLFEPFNTSKQKGTGLGLAISKRIIEAHRGTIDFQSFPGGTIFTITLSRVHEGENS